MNIVFACQKKNLTYYIIICIYILSIIFFTTIGILYETNIINRKKYKDSTWWHGVIGLFVILFGVIFFNRFFYYILKNKYDTNYFWKLTHLVAYLALTYVSPEQWPFWISIGIIWEFFECYMFCWPKNTIVCSGYSDIITNICGVLLGLLLKSNQLP